MARRIGSWWIKDGIDGRRIEAQGFASLLDTLPGFEWTEDHGDSAVLEKDFVETANYTEKVDTVDALQMSSHGNPNAFSVSNGSVSTSDTIRLGKATSRSSRRTRATFSNIRRRTRSGAGVRPSAGCTTCAGFITARTAAEARTPAGRTSPCTLRGCTPCARSSRSTRLGRLGRLPTSSSKDPTWSGRICA